MTRPLANKKIRRYRSTDGFFIPFLPLATATAAAEQNQKRDDDDPNGVVVKQVAQTVIHGSPPSKSIVEGRMPYATILCRSPVLCA